jgi:hypothetical protein
MSQLVDQDREKKQHCRDGAHQPVLLPRIVLMHLREVAFGHGIDNEEENDKPGIIDDDIDPANTKNPKATEFHMFTFIS